jgi:hypothetical protein
MRISLNLRNSGANQLQSERRRQAVGDRSPFAPEKNPEIRHSPAVFSQPRRLKITSAHLDLGRIEYDYAILDQGP